MPKHIAILVAMAVACAFGAVASTSQAAEYLVEGVGVASATNIKNTEESGTTNTLRGTPFGVATEIKCSHRVISEANINSGGTGKAKIEFSSCTVGKPANCTVKAPITIKVNTTLEEPSAGVFESRFASESGPFTEITLEGASCLLKGSPFPVEGTQKCELPAASTEAVTHELACKASGSSLTAGKKAATFESNAATLELESGARWSATNSPTFRQEKGEYPFAYEGKNTVNLGFNFKNNQVENVPECSKAKFTGTLAGPASTLVTTPTFETCAMTGEATTVTGTNCVIDWIVTRLIGPRKYAGELVIANSGGTCTITVVAKAPEAGCEFFVAGQGFSTGIEYERIEGTPKEVEARFTLSGVIFINNKMNCKSLGATGEIKGRVKFKNMSVQ